MKTITTEYLFEITVGFLFDLSQANKQNGELK